MIELAWWNGDARLRESLGRASAGGRAVADAEFVPVSHRWRREEQTAADIGQKQWDWRSRSGVDVADKGGAEGGAVALPEFVAADAVVGSEESVPRHCR